MSNNPWKAFLFETTTGVVGPEIKIKEGADFSLSLSGSSTAKFQLDKTALPAHDVDKWLESWKTSVVYTYNGIAFYAGVLISNPKEYNHEIQFDTADIRAILARRYLIKESDLDSAKIAKGVLSYKGLSLGTIAQEVVEFSLSKPGGNLPVVYASPRETAANDADHQRTYKAFNANTISCDEVLTKLSEVSRGPDIMFRPFMPIANQVVWEMYHGTERDPRIKQKIVPEWDLSAERNQSVSLEITRTDTHLTDRVISVGGGTNEAAVMAVTEDLSKTKNKYPLLESVVTVSDSENKTVVMNHAKSSLRQNRKPLREYTLNITPGGKYPLGTIWPGDLVRVYSKGFRNLPDGENKMRLLAISGGFGADEIRLSLQLDDQWG